MHTCSFCKDPVPAYDKPNKAHLTIGMDKDGHVHTHGDLSRVEDIQEMLRQASETVGIEMADVRKSNITEVVFHNRQRIGDILMFTCGVRDFKRAYPQVRVNVMSTCAHIWDHNPYVDRTLPATDFQVAAKAQLEGLSEDEKLKKSVFDIAPGKIFAKIGPGKLTNRSNWLDWHFANAYRVSIEDALKVQIPQGESRPDIYFTEEEYNAPRLFKDPYWVICITGEKSWGCKMYPFERWQEFINKNKGMLFVQIGAKEDEPPRLKGPNVIDHVGKTQDKLTGIRDLFKLFLNAEGSIGLVSFHMHLSGALYKPAIVVAGAREPVSFTRFPYHQYLSTDGCLPCSMPACWHCDINGCKSLVEYPDKLEKKIPKCVDMIHPDELSQALSRYYIGGRLKVGQVSEKPKLKNIVPTPVVMPVAAPIQEPVKEVFDWGKGAIHPDDWPFIEEIIKKNNVKTVLEFGAGLSTTLFHKSGVKLASFETETEWIEKVKKACGVEVFQWNGRELPEGYKLRDDYDLAFVDGPANGENRHEATRLAANHARIVIIHDASRQWETRWEAKYLKDGFNGPIKGGHWCHLWIKTPSFVKHCAPPQRPVNLNHKSIKLVSTARGWGGCARSITTIMKLLLEAGHDVEFIPFRNKVSSKEFIDCLKNGLSSVKVSNTYEAISGECDALLVYADDFVWEFPNIGDMFSNLKAKKKVMMVNYRRGGIGEIPWTKTFDRYLFLNGQQERDFLRFMPGASTAVYPPCTDLKYFFEETPDYSGDIRIVRHNSQGDTKFDKNFGNELANAHDSRQDLTITMMPGPSWIAPANRFFKMTRNCIPVPKFLAKGNLFWYSLPDGYLDMGPRVILEAMAVGLPVIADNWGGAPDRVTPECGWICDSKEEMLEVIKNVTNEELEQKGKAARKRAMEEFRPERWIEELTGEAVLA